MAEEFQSWVEANELSEDTVEILKDAGFFSLRSCKKLTEPLIQRHFSKSLPLAQILLLQDAVLTLQQEHSAQPQNNQSPATSNSVSAATSTPETGDKKSQDEAPAILPGTSGTPNMAAPSAQTETGNTGDLDYTRLCQLLDIGNGNGNQPNRVHQREHDGMEKINFSGGEPFLEKGGRYVGELTRYCKQDLGLPSVSIVSNGSLVKEKWFEDYGEYLDILAISCDSFDFETNDLIGRKQGQKDHVASLLKVHDWCNQYKVAFKINTVVNTYNKHEDMTEQIQQLQPVRWKIFQCLLMEGENAGPDALRNAEGFLVTDQEFEDFLTRHKEVACLVPESNKTMQNSYLILDEYMRFLDCRGGGKTPSRSLLDVGVDSALAKSGFDEKMFYKRGGKYVWSKADMKLDW